MSISDQLDAIEKRAEAATAGPWKAIHGDSYCAYPTVMRASGPHFILYDVADVEQATATDDVRFPGMDSDATFIAAARSDIPKLVAALRHAVAVAGEMRQGSHHDRIIRYEGMIGTIAGILDGEG